MRRVIVIATLPLLLVACQGANSVPAASGVPASSMPFSGGQIPAAGATFSKVNAPDEKGPPSATWIFASNGQVGNVDVYSAKTLELISQCTCTGVGLAVDPQSGDLAVATRSATVTVWHVKKKQITLFATLNMSQGPYSIGLAFDKKGDLYVANASNNVIDFFKASKIEAGGGNPTRTIATSQVNQLSYLAADAHSLLADGYNRYGQPILVSVNTRTGADTILQNVESGHVPEGIVFDLQENVILNSVGYQNTLTVFKKPWNGSPTSTFVYGSAENGYYSGISLNNSQNTLWAANYSLPSPPHAYGSVQANSYPLGSIGRSSTPIASEYYDNVAADPQAK